MAKVTLLGSLAISVGGVVSTSKAGNVESSVRLQADVQTTIEAELKHTARATSPDTKLIRSRAKSGVTDFNITATSEDKTMKNSISRKGNWWGTSLLGVPVWGSLLQLRDSTSASADSPHQESDREVQLLPLPPFFRNEVNNSRTG